MLQGARDPGLLRAIEHLDARMQQQIDERRQLPRREIVPDDFTTQRSAGGVPAVVHPHS